VSNNNNIAPKQSEFQDRAGGGRRKSIIKGGKLEDIKSINNVNQIISDKNQPAGSNYE
jgi:hypothetical protein